jgi:hypothetical protein
VAYQSRVSAERIAGAAAMKAVSTVDSIHDFIVNIFPLSVRKTRIEVIREALVISEICRAQ